MARACNLAPGSGNTDGGKRVRRVVTERDVRAAVHAGRLVLPARAIVTPSARDLAQRLGVAFVPTGGSGTGARGIGDTEREAPRSDRETVHVGIGADHGGFRLKEDLKPVIANLGFGVLDIGCYSLDPVDYPVYAARVADLVACGDAQWGIIVDGAGIGSAMVANKISGVRAALCYDLTTAQNAREHNDANVLTLGGTLIGQRLASEIVRTFLSTPFAGNRHARRVAMIDALDQERAAGGQRTKTGRPAPRDPNPSHGV